MKRCIAGLFVLAGCAPLSGDLELEDGPVPRTAPLTVVPLQSPESTPRREPCVVAETDGVFAGPDPGKVAQQPALPAELGRQLPVKREWLSSVDNSNEHYHHTVSVPRLRASRWYYLRLGDVVWPATVENHAQTPGQRWISFYIDRELADRVALFGVIARRCGCRRS